MASGSASPVVTVRCRLAIAPSGSLSNRSVRSWQRRTIWVGSLISPVEIALLVSSRCTARGSARSTWTGVAQAASNSNNPTEALGAAPHPVGGDDSPGLLLSGTPDEPPLPDQSPFGHQQKREAGEAHMLILCRWAAWPRQ